MTEVAAISEYDGYIHPRKAQPSRPQRRVTGMAVRMALMNANERKVKFASFFRKVFWNNGLLRGGIEVGIEFDRKETPTRTWS